MSNFSIEFYGVGGSSAYRSDKRKIFGSNTACSLVRAGDTNILFDLGAGAIAIEDIDNAHILLGHFHYDHIEGFPYFKPFFKSGVFNIYGWTSDDKTLSDIFYDYLRNPFSPITPDYFVANVNYHSISPPSEFFLDKAQKVKVETLPLNHPGGCVGYKVVYNNKSICYISDHEHAEEYQSRLSEFCNETSLLIYDAFFTQKEYDSLGVRGWGHSTHEKGVELADRAYAKRVALTHHNMSRSDEELLEIEKNIKAIRDDVFLTRERMVIEL